MNFYTKAWLIYLIVLIAVPLPAQDEQSLQPENQLRFYTDYAGFKDFNDKDHTYQEIYISFPDYQFSYIEKDRAYLAGYQISILLKDSTGTEIAKKEWQNFKRVDYLKQTENTTSLEIAGFSISPGDYILSVKLTDLNSQVAGFTDIPIQVPAFEKHQLQTSEIEFARSIKRSQSPNKFVKNNVEILPNPSRVFGIESPFVYFYAEIYNSNQQGNSPEKIRKKYLIIDDRGKIIKSSEKIIQPKSASSIWAEKINILDVISGKYLLKLKVADELGDNIFEREAELWINNPYKVISLAQYDENDLNEFRAQIEYIVERKELDFFDELNAEGKIRYINDFWKNKSPEFRIEHLKRFYSAQDRFGSPALPGWKSDRGRIFIMYGSPDEMVKEPTSLNTRAYEVWVYETLKNQGRVEFVFVDSGIVGNYRLVHSTIKSGERAEIYNPNWIDEIRIAR